MKADTVFDDGLITIRDALVEVPTIIGIIPCAAAYIMVAGTGELLICKPIGIAAKISQFFAIFTRSHLFIIKIIMRIYVLDEIISALFHLAAGIRRTINIEPLEGAVTALVVEVVFARIAEGEILDMYVLIIGRELQSACAVRGRAEVKNSQFTGVTGDNNIGISM